MSKTESFEFLNELALAFRRGESHPRPGNVPVLEGIRAVLAHLQSTGRLIPPGGMALTAEQAEDVEALVATANPYSAPAARLRALFPATEPAEEAPNLAAVAQEPRRFNPADECQNDNHDPGCMCGAQHWMTASAPAEPAEEETKAERRDPDELAKRLAWIWHDGWDACGERERGYLRRAAEMAHSHYASSPVVPAPTETGPWPTWQEVPEGVQYYGINGWGPTYYVNRGGVRYRVFDDTPSKTADYVVQNFAPFVAAAEEGRA